MAATIDANSVGIVTPQQMIHDASFTLASSKQLPGYTLAYETYGELNSQKSNAILICHALSGNAHAAGYHSLDDKKPGWWDNFIGPGKIIDTSRFFVVATNNLGGCDGSTGPLSTDPETGKAYGPDFPSVRVRDWVETQHHLMEYLGLESWVALIGGSLGGMQVMRWALNYPDKVKHSVIMASSMKLTTQNIAFNETARTAIMSDDAFHEGRYLENNTLPQKGLSLARMIGHLTYLSDDGMDKKFGRELRSGSFKLGQDSAIEFQVASYLHYQGGKFSTQFDANSYILMTTALDFFDLAREYNDDPVAAFSHATCDFLILSFSSDWRFSPERSKEIVDALIAANKSVAYTDIESTAGHDGFLLHNPRYESVFGAYMDRVYQTMLTESSGASR